MMLALSIAQLFTRLVQSSLILHSNQNNIISNGLLRRVLI
ncbi:hypothetical protein BMETH_1137_0 [methanotrophic bacterial endosymbiont of Bathymodiolus sp.]|nr:hypothetical protein BMETH_1137_0 [methanotrophic bacterial endosymbiont of Bathymodiolus sp.]